MNKYYSSYLNIINNRISNPIDNDYTEKHHIVPKSLGGTNESDNIVNLSAKEHFICHYLLTKVYPVGSVEWYKMQHAFMIMAASSNGKRYYNSRLYESCRKNFAATMSFSQSGNKNSQFGKVWITNISLERNQKIDAKDINYWLSIGWTKGRIIDFNNYKKTIYNKRTVTDNKRKLLEKTREDANALYQTYINSGCKSLGEFIRKGYYPYSKVSLSKMWKQYVPEYKHNVKQGKGYNKV